MADAPTSAREPDLAPALVSDAQRDAIEAEAERVLARRLAIGLPTGTIVVALALGLATTFATGILVLVGGALVGVIAWIWASLRTLTGDAPLPEHLEAEANAGLPFDDKRSRKLMLLRALKDLEAERAIGKLEADDFDVVAARYRRELKQLMRVMDDEIAPLRNKAEAAAAAYLANRKAEPIIVPAEETAASSASINRCPKCDTSNDADAKFCKACATALGESS